MRTTNTILFVAALVLSGCLADLRPAQLKEEAALPGDSAVKGRALIERAAEVHGLSNWSGHDTYEIVGTDVWQGLLGKAGNPWPHHEVDLTLQFVRGNFDGRAEFRNGEVAGTAWGMQSFETYEEDESGKREFVDNDDARFILAAYHYFFEFPERMRAAPVVHAVGKRDIRGKEYEVVFVSWGIEPSGEYDQYLVFIDPATGRIEKTQYTLRDFAGFAKGAMHFGDYREVGGALVPFRQTVTFDIDDDPEKFAHQLTVDSVTLDAAPVHAIAPDPSLPRIGDAKI